MTQSHVPLLPLRTARLLLRPVMNADLPMLFAILADGEVMKLALYERALSASEAQQFIDHDFSHNADDVEHFGVLCHNDDDRIIGFEGFLPCKYFPGDLEIGFVLPASTTEKATRPRGAATHRRLFSLLGRPRLLGLCDPRTVGSVNVLTKLGMHYRETIKTPDRGERAVYEVQRQPRQA